MQKNKIHFFNTHLLSEQLPITMSNFVAIGRRVSKHKDLINGTLKTELPYGTSPAIHVIMGSHCYPTQVNAPRPNPSPLTGIRFTDAGEMEGWVDLGYPAMEQPGVELVTCQSQVRRPSHYTTEPHITNNELHSHTGMWNCLFVIIQHALRLQRYCYLFCLQI